METTKIKIKTEDKSEVEQEVKEKINNQKGMTITIIQKIESKQI
jgi:hypothetical protein